jgi:hypothetical protein
MGRSPREPRPSGAPNPVRRADAVFGADLASLAAFRVAAALLVLADLGLRLRDFRAHYTDAGVLPREAFGGTSAGLWHASVHFLSGSGAFTAALFAAAAAAAVLLALGWRTRWMCAVSWYLLVSLHARNALVLQGGDVLLRLMLFWGMFLPLGERGSLNARRRPAGAPRAAVAAGLPVAAYFLQIAVMYWATALHKSGAEWRIEHSALYYALQIDYFARPFAEWLRGRPELLAPLGQIVLAFEALAPAALFSPWRTAAVRRALVPLFGLLQLGFGLAFEIGLFPWIAAAAMIPFWPGRPGEGVRRFSLPARAAAAAFLLFVLFWNAAQFDPFRSLLPAPARRAGFVLGLHQRWKMFAPAPTRHDGWIVVRGAYADGTRRDLRTGGPVTWRKPAHPAATFRNYRWRKYYTQITRKRYARYRPYLGGYFCREGNRKGGGPALEQVEIFFLLEKTLAQGTAPIRRITLGKYACE